MLTILTGDVIEQLRTLPDESVHCCVTSPPYWGLRDYGTAQWGGGEVGCNHIGIESRTVSGGDGKQYTNEGSNRVFSGDCKCGAKRIDSQLGLEKTPEEYVAKMVEVFREVRRVLRKDGTLWLNLGDSYGHGASADRQQSTNPGVGANTPEAKNSVGRNGLKAKDLCGIPWRVAFALQADGWWLRSDIIWAKPNPMPESVTDRPTKAHEYLFLLTKSADYFYDIEAIRERTGNEGYIRTANLDRSRYGDPDTIAMKGSQHSNHHDMANHPNGRNKRSVWTVATAPYPEAHFATYPPDLIKPCILAGTSAKGCCAKCGSPWERIVEVERKPRGDRFGNRDGAFDRGQAGSAYQQITESETIGWQPTCECEDIFDWLCGTCRNPLERRTPETKPCVILDCFAGSGTTGAVALELGRKAVLIELNPKYVELIERRCSVTMGLPLAV